MSTTAFAANTAEIYSETVTATADKTILVPVKIKNNSGIMGFKITVNYDKSVLTSPGITKGDITDNGLMNDSIGISPEGSFNVVWSGTQNENGDGTLMTLNFTAVKAEDTIIRLSYSQPDTFNEAWEDVELTCSDINICFSEDATVSEQKTEALTNLPSLLPNSEEIKNAVDIVLGETGKGHIDEIPEKDKSGFVDRINGVLAQLANNSDSPFESVDEIKDAYNDAVADEFVENIKESVDSNKIETAIKDSLDAVGAESIEQIPAERKEEFVQKVESNLALYAPDVDTVSDKLTADEAVEVIRQLQAENRVAATEGTKLPDPPKNNTVPIIILIASIIFLAVIITVTVVYIKRKKNEEAK